MFVDYPRFLQLQEIEDLTGILVVSSANPAGSAGTLVAGRQQELADTGSRENKVEVCLIEKAVNIEQQTVVDLFGEHHQDMHLPHEEHSCRNPVFRLKNTHTQVGIPVNILEGPEMLGKAEILVDDPAGTVGHSWLHQIDSHAAFSQEVPQQLSPQY